MSNSLNSGTQRVYMVRLCDYTRGHLMPLRVATAQTLVAAIERCAAECSSVPEPFNSRGLPELTVTVTIADLEVISE